MAVIECYPWKMQIFMKIRGRKSLLVSHLVGIFIKIEECILTSEEERSNPVTVSHQGCIDFITTRLNLWMWLESEVWVKKIGKKVCFSYPLKVWKKWKPYVTFALSFVRIEKNTDFLTNLRLYFQVTSIDST